MRKYLKEKYTSITENVATKYVKKKTLDIAIVILLKILLNKNKETGKFRPVLHIKETSDTQRFKTKKKNVET